jgi:glycosyltransferase involved in cell wall biosynthesis
VFGYLGTNRRLESVLEAIASFPDRHRMRLTILGELEQPEMIGERIRSLGLGDTVDVRGFVPETELDAELDRSHLAVNLRYPSMGEASGSQLRIWDRGLASIVTRTGWYAELPADSVWFVDPDAEIEQLQHHFRTALDHPERLRSIGSQGRRLLEERHDPAGYAGELAEGIARMMRTQASVTGEAIAAIARVLVETRITGAARAAVANHAADELSRWVSQENSQPPISNPQR